MNINELIQYTEVSLGKSGLKLSDFAKAEITKRFDKKESEGGYSSYWKETSLEDANSKRTLKVQSYKVEDGNRTIIWE